MPRRYGAGMDSSQIADPASAARVLLTRMVMLELVNDTFRGENTQMLGGMFGQVLTDRLGLPGARRDG